jgi:hypothetical protein
LRRIVIIGTALAVLGAATAAVAATQLNSYKAGFAFSPTKAGTKSKPVSIGYNQTYDAASLTAGNRAAPLVDIKTTIYGMRSNGNLSAFPKCTAAQITADHLNWDKKCPKGSMVAQGPVNAKLGPATTLVGAGTPCNPYLHVYNGGNNTIVFFFNIIPPKYTCGTLKTGASAPYFGHVSQQGKNLVLDVVLPPDVSTEAGGLAGVYGSLIHEQLTWSKITKTIKGKSVGFQESIGCKGGTRPWSVAYTAVNQGAKLPVATVTGTSKCS